MKEELKENLKNAVARAEHLLSMAKFNFKDRFNLLEPIKIFPFYGFGNEHYVFIKGRVLENEKIREKDPDGSDWQHLKDTYKRFETDEIPKIKVKASFAGREQEMQTDEEGFFEFEFKFDVPIDYNKHGKKVKLELLETKTDEDETETEGVIFVPDKDTEFGIISDIDDTVMVSRISDLLARLKLSLFDDASERAPFPGIAAFLRAVQKGKDEKGVNPLFFVSGSEWNLYDLLINFFKYHDIPEGPLFLKNKGIGREEGRIETKGSAHKIERIRHVLDSYPHLKFICIGDSGEQDPETYYHILEEYPNQIIGIYIRDVTSDERDKEVKEIKKKVEAKGAEMLLLEETYTAAKHALKMKWISEDQLEDIKRECEKDLKK
ncbi:phosphatase domain-containing protein [Salinimicrobium catena]|uniref:App1 family protein n=1 Tax=Salinimicrobium catena TaxID=390640 RepID=UPI002FE44B63